MIAKAAISPDGSRVALVTERGSSAVDITLLDSRSGREIMTLPDHTADIVYLDYLTPDRLAVIRGIGSVTIYHLDDNASDTVSLHGQPFLYNLHPHYYPEIGRIITSYSDSSIGIWNSRTGELIKKLETGHYIYDINLSADGTKLVTASGPMAQIWNLASGQELARFIVDKERDLTFTDFLGDDKLASAGTEVLYIYPISNERWFREAVRLKNSFKK
jgi:WD40 repeat protein